MRRYLMLILILIGFFVSSCVASFPAKYDPKYAVNPQLGKEQRVYATAYAHPGLPGESLKLQVLVDRKIEDWGFKKDKAGKNLVITVTKVEKAGGTAVALVTGFLCGSTFFIFPGIAVHHYQMTAIIHEEGKEPITREYNGSFKTYMQIFFTIWGPITYPFENAAYSTIGKMLDQLMNDLAEDNKKAVMRRSSDTL